MKFTKMHGLGNDYVYVDAIHQPLGDLHALARQVSDRHFGIGADGLICICPSEQADFRMRMFNADGSEGEMCGNGIRCVGKFVYDKGLTDQTTITVETLGGIKVLELTTEQGTVSMVTVDMGVPVVEAPATMVIQGKEYTGIPVSMGNPHCVVVTKDVDGLNLEEIGPDFEHHVLFPHRTNTEFIRVLSRSEIQMRVWERGSGETLACGTGACASVAAMAAAGLVDDRVTVHLLGGDLQIFRNGADGHMYMTGPAVTVFEGELAAQMG